MPRRWIEGFLEARRTRTGDRDMTSDRDSEYLVRCQDLGKAFGDFIALHPLNVRVKAGEFFGVFGPNGAGKSTFIRLLTGQLRPSIGRAEVLGIDVSKSPQKVKANVGIVPESESPPSFLTAAEYLEFVARLRNLDDMEQKVTHWLKWFGIDDRSDTLCKDLSKGQRQKVMLAAAFIHEPRLLFLDEPFVNLDPIYQRKCRELLKEHVEQGGTIFLCSHILEVAERLCTRVAVIDQGKVLASGVVADLKEEQSETLEDVFIRLVGTPIEELESRADGLHEEE
uniref:ABC transporter ATP-binding protein (ABC-2.A) n=1 Tax=uncultured marine group II/III euryarchaeote KM3_109_G01 TaxID=1457850 RepID=A0A075G5R5_9EURY|nr:ABC transporter ATP-binding protein (ABC-2.A) [uncultured marine group II/III euryarchaeote KM3_109_G01]